MPGRDGQNSSEGGMEGRMLQRLPGASWDFIQPATGVTEKCEAKRGSGKVIFAF